MKNNNNYNPYNFILFFPLAIISGVVFFIFETWPILDNVALIILITILFSAITFLGYHLSRTNHPLRGMKHERGGIEDIMQKIIEQKKGPISDLEMISLRSKAQNINNSTYRRAERTMRLKLLLEEFLKNK